MRSSWIVLCPVLIAATVQGQSLTLQIETGPGLADGVLTTGETASFLVQAFGTPPADQRYGMFGSLYGFSFGSLGPGDLIHTDENSRLTSFPGHPGLLYDSDMGTVRMEPTGGFVQLLSVGPLDTSNPIFLFSFDWTPSSYDPRMVEWAADASSGLIYAGGKNPNTWLEYPVISVGSDSGSFRIVPAPGACALGGVVGVIWLRRRRRSRF